MLDVIHCSSDFKADKVSSCDDAKSRSIFHKPKSNKYYSSVSYTLNHQIISESLSDESDVSDEPCCAKVDSNLERNVQTYEDKPYQYEDTDVDSVIEEDIYKTFEQMKLLGLPTSFGKNCCFKSK